MLISLISQKETKILAGISFSALVLLFETGKSLIASGFDQMIVIMFVGIFLFPTFMVMKLVNIEKIPIPSIFEKLNGSFWIILAICISAAFVWDLYSPTIGAKWSMIDDHEIKYFLAGQERIALSDIFPKLMHTEVGHFGDYTRFRPFYFFMRLLECVLWGNRPGFWYLFRMCILGLALFSFWTFVKPLLGWLTGGLLCLSTLTSTYWADIFSRLGPGETYAVAGLVLFIFGFLGVFKRLTNENSKYLYDGLLLVGTVICVGSKENFLLLIFPLIYLAYEYYKKRNYKPLVFIGAGLGYSFFVAIAIMIAVSKSGVDIYSNPVSIGMRLVTFREAFQNTGLQSIFLILLGTMLLTGALLLFRKYRNVKNRIMLTQFWFLLIIIFLISQLVFYNGMWPTGTRYDFPGMLFIPAMILVIWQLLMNIISGETFEILLQRALKISLIFNLTFFLFLKGFGYQTQMIKENVRSTIEFSNRIENTIVLLKQNENSALVLESSNPLDYEPVFSYARFLTAENVKNKIFFRFHTSISNTPISNLEKVLLLELNRISTDGNSYISPLRDLTQFENRCFSITLSGNYLSNCSPIN